MDNYDNSAMSTEESDFEDDGSLCDEIGEEQVELLDFIPQSKTLHSLSGLRSTYASQWGPREAFRELVQNW